MIRKILGRVFLTFVLFFVICAFKLYASPSLYMVKDINLIGIGSYPKYLTESDGRLYFSADDPIHGNELWVSDGTTDGTLMVTDIYPGTDSSSPEGLIACNTFVYFSADDGIHGRELWVSDGTESGTMLVKDIRPGIEATLRTDSKQQTATPADAFLRSQPPGNPGGSGEQKAVWKDI